tara:strand:- start:140 stop:466 length:327 start_codon:yes stop_codon:yes gene_type:complete
MEAARSAGSLLRKEIYGEDLEFAAEDDTRYEVTGVMSGAVERQENGEGGIMLDNDGQVRVLKVDAETAGLVPEVGMMVRRMSGGKVYRVDAVTVHDGSGEWKLDVNAV